MEISQATRLPSKYPHPNPSLASQRNVEFVLENLKDLAIFLIDSEGIICSWNRGSERVFGFQDAEVIGKSFSTIFTPEDVLAGIPMRELTTAKSEGKAEDERWHQRKDGSRFWASGAVEPVAGENGEQQFIKVVRDATDRKRAEDADRMESIGRLAGGMAHDYNNMLTSILGYGELLASSTPMEAFQQVWLDEIVTAAGRAAALTQDLLAFSRRQMITPKPMNLNDTVRKLQGRLRMILGERVQLFIRLDPDLENALLDRERIEQVLLNLALNAREAMPEGGVVDIGTRSAKAIAKAGINASVAEAATAASSANALNAASAASGREILPGPSGEAAEPEARDYITLVFKDNGKGMDAETAAHAFDPFFSTKPKSTGSVGLGLSTGYGIIQQSGGTISLTSVLGGGTEIEIHLPVFRETDLPSGPEAHSAPPVPGFAPGGESKRKKTVLLVEDEIAVRKLAYHVLRNSGFEVLEAKDGEEGLAIYHAQSLAIDMIVTDVVMPKLGGLAMAQKILSRHPEAHILFMSGYSEDPISSLTMPHVNCAFLHKPFTVADLLRKIDASIRSQPGEAKG
jgi:PAS domain S-box-containing protein